MADGQLDPVEREEVRRRTMQAPRPMGRGLLAVVVAVPLLLGMMAGAIGGFMLNGSRTAATSTGAKVSFELKAFISGYVGVGGSIDALRDPDLNVSVGDTVTITLVDGEATAHNLYVETYDVRTPNVQGAGSTGQVTFVAGKEGTFPYYCEFPMHRQMGMEGKLIVGSGQGTGPAVLPPIGPVVGPTVDIVHSPADIPPPITRTTPATVDIWLDAREVNGVLERTPTTGQYATFQYWTFNATVPGPFFRVRVNDTVRVHFSNNASSNMTHSVDFHAATGPGGGMAASMADPGQSHVFSFKALVPGLFVYHCGTPNVPTHVSMGMYGMILVQPDIPLASVDSRGQPIKEYYVMQGDIYTKWPIHSWGNQIFDGDRLLSETPTYVVFNGAYQALTNTSKQLTAIVNDTVRIYFGVGGPNVISSFHIIGEIFDRVYLYGGLIDPPLHGLQTVLVPPGGTVVVELTCNYAAPGGTNYLLVDHALVNAVDLGAVGFLHVSGWTNSTVFSPTA